MPRVLVLLITALSAVPTRAQTESPTPPPVSAESAPPQEEVQPELESAEQPAQPEAPAEAKPLPAPKYRPLRYDEDFSYLDGEPGTYQPDFFDPIKNIHLAEDLTLSIGGSFRFRMEAESNKDFDVSPRTQDTFQLYQYLLHFDVRYRKLARVFFEGVSAFDEDRDLADRPIDENRWDVHQLFGDVRVLGEDVPLTLRIGRQELLYGQERLIAPAGWTNVRRRFDAVKLLWSDETWNFDVFYAKPVVAKRIQGDDWDEDLDLYGAYATYKGIPRHGIDVYFFAVDDTSNKPNPNGRRGDISRYTFGGRLWGETAGFDYETELAGQWGTWSGDTIQAWSWTVLGGYTFADCPWTPRIGAGFDLATGDEDPGDAKVGTFDQLFPTGHAYFGYIDVVGRQNVTAVNVTASAWPVKDKVKAALAYHTFWLNDPHDALYNAAGGIVRRDPTGRSGTEVGHEIDLTLEWKLDVHSSLLFGYSHFWDSDFIIETGKSEDPDLVYLQYAFRF